MLKNENIICISSIDWDFLWQGHQEIMTRFARAGNQVFFIENTGVRSPTLKDLPRLRKRFLNWKKGVRGIRKIEDNLYLYSPLVLPFPYSRICRSLNKRIILSSLSRWLKAMRISSPTLWTFLPTGLVLDIINKMDYSVLVYYCIDSFVASSIEAKKIVKTEKEIIRKSDLVFVTSGELNRYCSEYSSNIYNFPFGVNIENFEKVRDDVHTQKPVDMNDIKEPVIGYIGGIHKWIDIDLLAFLAEKNPEKSFVLVGPVQTDIHKIKSLKNIFILGQKPLAELPRYVKYFDVCLIPYRITEYTRNVYPTKMNEYLIMGKPVVSSALPEVIEFNRMHDSVISIANSPEEFNSNINKALGDDKCGDAPEAALRIMQARKNSWHSKVEEMSRLIMAASEGRAKERQKDWSLNLKRLYRSTRRGMPKLAVILLFLYLVIFQTDIGWQIGKPLLVEDSPEKADAIVVLGGGVGESGKAGQGYEERVTKAVWLYKNGYGKYIIYSTGYKHILKEAEVMKALSLSLGVDKENIIIDDTPENTYENIVSVGRILKERRWKKINLITSKYHMQRSRLVCSKNMPDVIVRYVPTESTYYGGKKLTFRHIRGFLYEYLAMIYYKLKGYL